ncbi:unnamed protein product, partial [Nesidiocoris tenuis]
ARAGKSRLYGPYLIRKARGDWRFLLDRVRDSYITLVVKEVSTIAESFLSVYIRDLSEMWGCWFKFITRTAVHVSEMLKNRLEFGEIILRGPDQFSGK